MTMQEQMIRQSRPVVFAKLAKHRSTFDIDEQEAWLCAAIDTVHFRYMAEHINAICQPGCEAD